jgi:hypothetical protein
MSRDWGVLFELGAQCGYDAGSTDLEQDLAFLPACIPERRAALRRRSHRTFASNVRIADRPKYVPQFAVEHATEVRL